MARAPRVAEHPELGLPERRKLWQTEGLFSDHYLKTKSARNTWWPNDSEAEPIWHFCKELYEKRYVACARNNEQFTRQELLDKIFERLGFAWTDNLSLPETQQHLEPDYILFASAAEKEAVIDRSPTERYRSAIVIVEAKKVNHPLSQISRTQLRYPHQQIRDYLNEAQTLGWGILTSGNEWRLYARDAKPSHFFGLDFSAAIESLENFKYFIALFSPTSFVRDAQGRCRLDAMRESALATQVKLEEDLRLRVFTILEILANGFFSRPENQISESDLPLLYDRCLIFLYRLLFILYAEGRDLLPVQPKSRRYYKDLSLSRLTSALKNFADYDSHTRTRLFEDIRELCNLINGTDESKNREYLVPRYNGGLFDSARYPQLERWRVSDAALADVLRGLMFSPPPERDQPSLPVETVDFGDLRVQQLGSIYEGLLEHHFVREKDGRLTLKTDKAERKATGTYYTPDYIVKYIVDQTIRPLLDEIEASAPVQSARAASRQDNSFADAVLQLNVCDPAMGSGHFLVEATTFLADQIVYHPTTKFQAAKEKGVPQEQTEIAYWRRRVVESCIYAIDLNPLAVELAKLSLWLTTIASDQPLNFLDHHLCCGNSLIGACIDQLGALPKRKKSRGKSHKIDKQTRFSFGPDFKRVISETIRQIHSIEEKASAEVNAVKEKEKRWQEKVLPALAPYKAVADLWTSTFFGNALDEETYLAGAQKILAGDKVNNPQASTRRFFHWELEFPEVFFADDGAQRAGPGFDAMISNPPYIDIKGLDDGMVDYLFEVFPTARLRVNIFAAFIEQSIVEARAQFGHVGLIIPTAFLTQVSYSQLRQLILQNYSLKKLVRLPNELFGAAAGEVKVDTCVVVVQKKPTVSARTECLIYNSFQRVTQLSSETASTAFEREQQKWLAEQDAPITLAAGDDENVLAKMRSKCIALDAVCEFCLGLTPYDKYAGHTKEQIEKRVFHANSQLDPSYKRLLVSGDVRRYEVEWNGEQWIKYGDWLAAPREQRFFTEPRILVQQIIDWSSLRILAGWTDEELYNTQNQFNLLAKADTNLKFVLALLNSKLISYYHRRAFLDVALQRFQKILIKDAKTFPIRRIELSTPAKHRAALLEKAKQLVAEAVAENDAGEVVRFVEEQLAPQPERADVVHDLLGFLAGEMTRLNSEKLAAAHGFIVDLKDFHGIDAYALTPKTRLNEFWKLDAPEFFAHLRKNVRTLAARDVHLDAGDEGKIRVRFTRAKETLLPLEARFDFTDALIDQIVYRLYGLGESEIALVESPAA